MATYDIEQVSVTINGIPVTGLDPNEGVELEANDLWEVTTGTHRHWVRSRVYGDVPVLPLALMKTSNGNEILSELLRADTATGRAIFSFQVFDGNSGSLVRSSTAYISAEPAVSFVGEAGTIVWSIALPNVERDLRGLPQL